jgi:hypothetical protein
MLAACGGGGSSSGSAPPATGNSAPPQTSSTTPPPASSTTTPTTQTFTPPLAPTSAFKLTAGAFNEGSTSQNVVVTFSKAVDLTVSGGLNNIWVSAADPGGKATVSSDMNTIVFMPGVSAQVTVTGSGNTFYVPTGASITILGTGAASSTIRNYIP